MDWVKIILVALGLLVIVALLFWIVGVVYAILYYLFWAAILGALGYGGYKLFKKDETKKLENQEPITIAEMRDADRALKEYKRKYLPK